MLRLWRCPEMAEAGFKPRQSCTRALTLNLYTVLACMWWPSGYFTVSLGRQAQWTHSEWIHWALSTSLPGFSTISFFLREKARRRCYLRTELEDQVRFPFLWGCHSPRRGKGSCNRHWSWHGPWLGQSLDEFLPWMKHSDIKGVPSSNSQSA